MGDTIGGTLGGSPRGIPLGDTLEDFLGPSRADALGVVCGGESREVAWKDPERNGLRHAWGLELIRY